MTEVLTREIALRCAPAHAFRVFTETVDLWWPRGHRKNAAGRLRFEPGPQGRLLDVGPDGSDWTMAAVRVFEPPRQLVLDWFPGSPAAPTRVEITFDPAEDGTLVRIVHSAPTAEAAEIWPKRVALFAAGWDAVLPALKSQTEETEG